MALEIAFLSYPDLTQLDLTGPFEFLSKLEGVHCTTVWKERGPVRSDSGLILHAELRLAEMPKPDVLCIPGGPGQMPLMEDPAVLYWIAEAGASARYVTSVCVGSLLLGAAGLLEGYRATCHWASLPFLSAYGAIASEERVVKDRNRITGGGVTAGIDFGIALAAELSSVSVAQEIQLALEYDPAPPFDCGHPRVAPEATVNRVRQRFAARLERRAEQAARYRNSAR